MKTIYADFNAMTEAEHIRLTPRGSEADIRRFDIQMSDWVWLGDGELVVGAQVLNDPYYGRVGIPAWDTLINLEDASAENFENVRNELQSLLRIEPRDSEGEKRLLYLLTAFEKLVPPAALDAIEPGYVAYRQARALMALGYFPLAKLMIREALEKRPEYPPYTTLHLEILRHINIDDAVAEARRLAAPSDAEAVVLATCINVLATLADHLDDPESDPVLVQLDEWIDRFERAPGRDSVPASLLALVEFNRGMLALRAGRTEEARARFHIAYQLNPNNPIIQELNQITDFDDRAKDIAVRMHSRPVLTAA